MLADMTIEFWENIDFVDILQVLFEFGWKYSYQSINFRSEVGDLETGDWGFEYHSNPDWSWMEAQTEMQRVLGSGSRVWLILNYDGIVPEFDEIEVDFEFRVGNKLVATLNGLPPKISKGSKFTDYSWLIRNIAEPLHKRGHTIYEVSCVDHFD